MIEVVGVRVSYGLQGPALDGVSLTVRPGELVALVGANGSGKSTLGALLCGGRVADAGYVTVDGRDPAAGESERRAVRALAGMVWQDPCDQIVASLVFDEVAFGPRNLGLPEDEVTERVATALGLAGLTGFESRTTTDLSGGEQQRIALAGVLAMHPRYLVLDEVTCQQDAVMRPAFRALFARLAHDEGLGVVQITHDPIEIVQSDRVVVLEAGHVAWEGAPCELLDAEGLPVGALASEDDASRSALRAVLTGENKADASVLTEELNRRLEAHPDASKQDSPAGSALLELKNASFSYGDHLVLDQVNLSLRAGRVLLLAGRSGSGKSTLAQLAAGLLEPSEGCVTYRGQAVHPGDVALAFQNPEGQFFLDTVRDELAFAARNQGVDEGEAARRVARAAALVGLPDNLLDRYPFELSGGQARRVAIGSMLTLGADVCILDEPSAGLDVEGRRFAHKLVRTLADEGLAVMVISHDVEEWLPVVDDVAVTKGTVLLSRSRGLETALSTPTVPIVPDPGTSSTADRDKRTVPFVTLDARVLIAGLFALTACVFLSHTLGAMAVWLALAAAVLAAVGMGPRAALRALRPVCLVLAFALCANLVSCDGGGAIPLVGPVGLSPEGGLRGLVAVLRIVALVACSIAVASSVTPTAVSDSIVRLLRPLARLGLPVGALGTVLSLALRFIPLVGEELTRIRIAQRARGVRFDEGSVVRRIRVWTSVLTPLIVGLFRRADRLADAMAARCYAGAGAVQVPRRPLAARDRAVLIAIALVTVVTLAFSLKGLI